LDSSTSRIFLFVCFWYFTIIYIYDITTTKEALGKKLPFFIHYGITDPKYYTNNIDVFSKTVYEVLDSKKVNFFCFRDKISPNIQPLAKVFKQICNNYTNIKTFINSDINLASKLNYDGVHLTSSQFFDIKKAKDLNLIVIISCHNFQEVKQAYELGADFVTFSPIFYTPHKAKPKGIDALKALLNQTKDYKNFGIIALGGISTQKKISQIQQTGAIGFASIRYFIN
jgi:thiamine-phosphate pyrophosphorylase